MDRMKIATIAGRELAEEQTKRGTEWTIAWISMALSLERSADILWKTLEEDWGAMRNNQEPKSYQSVSGSFMLLAGLTVENYLKAICIKRTGAYSEKGGFLYGIHNFLNLAKESALSYSTEELELIEKLEHFVVFAGRYPAPMKADALLPRLRSDGSWGSLSNVTSADHGQWKSLLKRLSAELDT